MLSTAMIFLRSMALTLMMVSEEILEFVRGLFTFDYVLYLIVMLVAVMAGTTVGLGVKHYHAQNFTFPSREDMNYYLIAGGLWIGLSLMGADPGQSFWTMTSLKAVLGLVENRRNGAKAT